MTLVLETRVRDIAVLTLNRPTKRNAASLDLQVELGEKLQALLEDASVRAMVLTGAGRTFCAGGDLELFRAIGESQGLRDTIQRMHARMMDCLLDLEIPTVAAINGPAVGFGAELAALCDMKVMGEHAYICDPHVRFGVEAGPACRLIWPRLTSRAIAMELLLTGRKMNATEAVRVGLANCTTPEGTELQTAIALASKLAELPWEGLVATKRNFRRSFAGGNTC